MKKKLNIISLIPAKGTSSRLKNKNLRNFKGKTLLEHAINSSVECKLINETFVSSEKKKILEIAIKKRCKIRIRPNYLSKTKTKANEVIKDFIINLDKKYDKNTIIVYLQPTSPMRKSYDVKKALQKFIKYKRTLYSFYEQKNKSYLKSFFGNSNNVEPICPNFSNSNDQELPKVFFQNGAIYIFTIDAFMKKFQIPLFNIIPYIMREEKSLDVNFYEDLKYIK